MRFGTANKRASRRDRRGATVIEYATFTALVAGVVIVGLEQIGSSTSSTYSSLSKQIHQPTADTPAKPTAPVASGFAETDAPLVRNRLVWQVPVLAGLGVLWMLLVLKRSQARRAQERAESMLEAEQVTGNNSDARLFAKRQQILSTLVNDVRALSTGEVAVRHVMSSRLTTMQPTASLKEVGELMAEKKMRHMLVCDGDRLLGIISDRDLARKTGRTAADVMTASPLSVPPDTLLSPAVTLMMRKRISCLPVVEEGRLCGLFTTTDLIMTLQCAFQLLEKVAPHLTELTKTAKPVSLRDTFTGLGEFAGDAKQATASTGSAATGSVAMASTAAYSAEGGETEPFMEDVNALETHAAH
jgi:CBS domain-containing protein/Flp pilus assembly pilin Flp